MKPGSGKQLVNNAAMLVFASSPYIPTLSRIYSVRPGWALYGKIPRLESLRAAFQLSLYMGDTLRRAGGGRKAACPSYPPTSLQPLLLTLGFCQHSSNSSFPYEEKAHGGWALL